MSDRKDQTRPTASARHLRDALVGMTIAYGDLMQAHGMHDGQTLDHWWNAATAQLAEIRRLADAIRDVEVTA